MTMQVAGGLRSYATARCNDGERRHAKATAIASVHYTHTPIYLPFFTDHWCTNTDIIIVFQSCLETLVNTRYIHGTKKHLLLVTSYDSFQIQQIIRSWCMVDDCLFLQ